MLIIATLCTYWRKSDWLQSTLYYTKTLFIIGTYSHSCSVCHFSCYFVNICEPITVPNYSIRFDKSLEGHLFHLRSSTNYDIYKEQSYILLFTKSQSSPKFELLSNQWLEVREGLPLLLHLIGPIARGGGGGGVLDSLLYLLARGQQHLLGYTYLSRPEASGGRTVSHRTTGRLTLESLECVSEAGPFLHLWGVRLTLVGVAGCVHGVGGEGGVVAAVSACNTNWLCIKKQSIYPIKTHSIITKKKAKYYYIRSEIIRKWTVNEKLNCAPSISDFSATAISVQWILTRATKSIFEGSFPRQCGQSGGLAKLSQLSNGSSSQTHRLLECGKHFRISQFARKASICLYMGLIVVWINDKKKKKNCSPTARWYVEGLHLRGEGLHLRSEGLHLRGEVMRGPAIGWTASKNGRVVVTIATELVGTVIPARVGQVRKESSANEFWMASERT